MVLQKIFELSLSSIVPLLLLGAWPLKKKTREEFADGGQCVIQKHYGRADNYENVDVMSKEQFQLQSSAPRLSFKHFEFVLKESRKRL